MSSGTSTDKFQSAGTFGFEPTAQITARHDTAKLLKQLTAFAEWVLTIDTPAIWSTDVIDRAKEALGR